MNPIDIALSIATKAHASQLDRDGYPAILHPLTVGLMGHTDEEKMAGFLHDVVEDSPYIIRKTKCYRFTKRNVPKRKTKRLRYRCPPEPYSNSVRTDFFSYSNAIILENQQINTSI